MKTYQIKLSDGTSCSIKATCASDAIQDALIKNAGQSVATCHLGDGRSGIHYDVPPHKALTPEQVAAMKPEEKQPRRTEAAIPQRPAPWIEEWISQKVGRTLP